MYGVLWLFEREKTTKPNHLRLRHIRFCTFLNFTPRIMILGVRVPRAFRKYTTLSQSVTMPLLSCPHIELSGQLKKANNADLTFYMHTTQTTFHRVGTMQCLYKLYLICWYIFCQLLLFVVFPSCINSQQKLNKKLHRLCFCSFEFVTCLLNSLLFQIWL